MTKDWKVAQDLTLDVFDDVAVNLFDLYRARIGLGLRDVSGITFRNCRIEGPAVMLVVGGCTFDGVNFGSNGDIASLVLRPASKTSVVGAIPTLNCKFINTGFFGVGFTGPEPFLNQILAVGSPQ